MTGVPPPLSARDRLEEALARIADANGEGSRACLTVYSQVARNAADAADAGARAGMTLGPLDGTIVSIKDLFDVSCAQWPRSQVVSNGGCGGTPFFSVTDVVLIRPRQRSALLAPASPQTRVTNAERRGRVDRRVRSRRGERTARSALSRLRHPSRGKISHGGSLAARAGKSAQTPRRTAPPLRLVDVMRRRPVGDRRRHRSGRYMVRTLNSNS